MVLLSQSEGIGCKENLLKECDEEAAIPAFLAEKYVDYHLSENLLIIWCGLKSFLLLGINTLLFKVNLDYLHYLCEVSKNRKFFPEF